MWVVRFVLLPPFDQLDLRRKGLRRTKRVSSGKPDWNLQSSVSTPDRRTSRRASPSRLQITEATGVSILQDENILLVSLNPLVVKRSYWPVYMRRNI